MNGQGAVGVARRLCALALVLVLSACASSAGIRVKQSEFVALENAMERHVDVLASVEFAGRRPGTPGETRTLAYLRGEMERAGYVSGTNDPANPWNAPVRLVSVTGGESRIEIVNGKRRITLDPASATGFTDRRRGLVEGGEMVFVGHESENVAPDLVRGRVVVMLSEPGVSPSRRAQLLEAGPAAVITVVEGAETVEQMRQLRARERLVLASEGADDLLVFVTDDAMGDALGGSVWQKLRDAATEGHAAGGFAPKLLDARINIDTRSTRREVMSHNFIARLPGTDPNAGAILLLAHWDHFGECGPPDAEDRLCNGAVDNASGIALMIELAQRLAKGKPLARDIYVLGTTAEEWGLLGARAFAEEPPVPLESFVAAFNFDTVAIAPRGSAVGYIGEGMTPLDPLVFEAVKKARRELAPRELTEPFLQRQDGWALLQRDVPTVLLSNAFGDEEKMMAFLATKYHQATDEPGALELGGAVDDLLLHEYLIRRIADPAKYP